MGRPEAEFLEQLDHALAQAAKCSPAGGQGAADLRWALDDAKGTVPPSWTRVLALLDLAGRALEAAGAGPAEAAASLGALVVDSLKGLASTVREGATGGAAVEQAIAALKMALGPAAAAPAPASAPSAPAVAAPAPASAAAPAPPAKASAPAPAPVAAAPAPTPAAPPAPAPEAAPDVWRLLPDDADRELLGEYVTENLELLQGAEAALLTLETDPEDEEAINTVFRAFHTIKGTSAFVDVAPVATLAHKAETLLARVRDKQIRYGGIYADLALRSSDAIKELMFALNAAMAGEEPPKPAGYDELLASLADPEALIAAGAAAEEHDVEPPHIRMADILVAEGKVEPQVVQAVADARGDDKLGVAMVKAGVVGATDVADALRKQKKLDKLRNAAVDSSVRVRTDRLDRLIEMVGELVIAQSMVEQDPTVRDGAHFDLARKTSHMGKIVRELQDLSMAMRMVPLKSTFQKMARLSRDLSQKIGKEVEFTSEGEDTEIDRNMVDAVGDPLVHMIRNAVDHGIELPDDRAAAGKERTGHVHLSACHSGGSVVVTIVDDGRGLDRDKIVRKALAKGIIDSDKGLSDDDVWSLLFAPGFSTAEKVTDVSGRGVGLDVVKRNVEGMRGRIDISTRLGGGTTFAIYLPLTLAITDGMLIRVGGQRYILPTANIAKAFRPTRKEISTVVGAGEMVSYSDAHIPLFRLARLFHVDGAIDDPTRGLLVVVRDGGGYYALLADEIIGQQQIVAKSLGEGVPKVPGVSGGAILGDGRVGLILDPPGLGALARRGSEADGSSAAPAAVA